MAAEMVAHRGFLVCLVLAVIAGPAASQKQCSDYSNMTMYNGRRNADYSTALTDIAICDYQKYGDGDWVRFEHPTGNRITEMCVASGRCGTDIPMWMNGTHPKAEGQTVQSKLCMTYRDACCYASQEVNVTLCPGSFYVYQMEALGGCEVAFCMHPLDPCSGKGTWSYKEGKCIGNNPPELVGSTTFWSPLGQTLRTFLNFKDDDGDDVTSGFFYAVPDGLTLWYNGQLTMDSSLTENMTVTIQLTDNRQGTKQYELHLFKYECQCQNGGTCSQDDVHSSKSQCQCDSTQYYGDLCEIMADTCGPAYCQHGKCEDDRCICEIGFQGDSCESPLTTTTTTTTTRIPDITTSSTTATTTPAATPEWSEWGMCSKDCGFGVKTRHRTCSTGICYEKELCSAGNCAEEDTTGVVVEFVGGLEDLSEILLVQNDWLEEFFYGVADIANNRCYEDHQNRCCDDQDSDARVSDPTKYPYITAEDIRVVMGYPRIAKSGRLRFKIIAETEDAPRACGWRVGEFSVPLRDLMEAIEEYLEKSVLEGTCPDIHAIWIETEGPQEDDDEGLSTVAIGGIAVATLVALIVLGLLIWLYFKRNDKKNPAFSKNQVYGDMHGNEHLYNNGYTSDEKPVSVVPVYDYIHDEKIAWGPPPEVVKEGDYQHLNERPQDAPYEKIKY